jgi:hypothetical protein
LERLAGDKAKHPAQLQVLLEPFEKQFDRPSLAVDVRNFGRNEFGVVCGNFDLLACILVVQPKDVQRIAKFLTIIAG